MTHHVRPKTSHARCRWPFILAGWLIAPAALACSTMALGPPESPLIAYSYDTSATGRGFIIVNPAGGERTSIMESSTARWQTRYGSVSFNQMGPGMPTVGINTAGLVVSLMWNDDVVFPETESSDIINELELIQRILDRAASIDEAVTLASNADVQALVPIHYFVADATGATAAIMPTRARMIMHRGANMPIRALTNSSYADLVDGLSGYEGFGGTAPLPHRAATQNPNSLERFVLAASAARSDEPVTVAEAFDALATVENPETRWQIVIEPGKQVIDFTLTGAATQWQIDMSGLDFSCAQIPLGQSLSELASGDAEVRFRPVEPDQLAGVVADVLDGFSGTIGLPREIAGPLTQAQIGALTCGE